MELLQQSRSSERQVSSSVSVPAPHLICVPGGSGAVMRDKVVPELYQLWLKGLIPENTTILGAARSPLTTEQFRQKLFAGVQKANLPLEQWNKFEQRLHYISGNFYGDDSTNRSEDYRRLAQLVNALDAEYSLKGNRIFYLALPSHCYVEVTHQLSAAGLLQPQMQLVTA